MLLFVLCQIIISHLKKMIAQSFYSNNANLLRYPQAPGFAGWNLHQPFMLRHVITDREGIGTDFVFLMFL